jgi:hypothetical protein
MATLGADDVARGFVLGWARLTDMGMALVIRQVTEL